MLESQLASINQVVFSPDGQLLASGSDDNTVKLWDSVTGDLHGTLEDHSDSIQTIAFSPDGQLLASGSRDKTVKLWNPVTGDLHGTLEGHSDYIWTMAFSPDGQLLASASLDMTVKLWDPVTRDLRGTLEGHSDYIWTIAFSPDGQLLASASWDHIGIWLIEKKTLVQRIKHNHDTSLEFSRDGSQLLADGKAFDISSDYSTASSQERASADMFSPLVRVEDQWVIWKNYNVLWLPVNRRPPTHATKEETLAIGSESGRMTILLFSSTIPPF